VTASAVALEVLGRDPVMARLIGEQGVCGWGIHPPFPSLVRSIVGQQVSNAVARILHRRLLLAYPSRRAMAVARLPALRALGLSQRKAEYVRGVARFACDGGLRGLQALDDAEVAARLTTLRGVGPWTADMFLIFSLGRLDVWPLGDLGIVLTIERIYGLSLPGEQQALGDRFRPFRSIAAGYLWGAHDGAG
jgi:DNA-3-methyladenine glycosylase II